MNRRVLGVVAFAVAVLAATAAGQEAVTFKEHTAKVGERTRVTEDVTNTTTTTFAAGGKQVKKVEAKGRSTVYVNEVLEMPASGRRPTKVRRTYEKAVDIADGKPTRRATEGKTVLIEKAGDKYTFAVGGGGELGKDAEELEKEFNKKDEKDSRKDLIPDRPLKPGETWTISKERIVKELEGQPLQLDKENVSGGGKLVRAYQKDGRQFGVIEITLALPVTGLGANNPVAVKTGSKLTITLTGDGCLDGSVPAGTTVTRTVFTLEGSVMGTDLQVKSEGTETQKIEPLPPK
jgi:hypothetical protein